MPNNWDRPRSEFTVLIIAGIIFIGLTSLALGYSLAVEHDAQDNRPVLETGYLIYRDFTVVIDRDIISELWIDTTSARFEDTACDGYTENDEAHTCVIAESLAIQNLLSTVHLELPYKGK